MIDIRPVSDLRNKFPEVESSVINSGNPVFLTKNGYGTMVLMSIEQFEDLSTDIESKLDEADIASKMSSKRLTKDEAFNSARGLIDDSL